MPVRFLRSIRTLLALVWNGPHELSRPLRLEWRIVLGRWLAIVCVGLAVSVHSTMSGPQTRAAYEILALALIYTLVLQHLVRRQHPAVVSGTLPTLADGLLCALMLPLFGGFASSFYAILYLVAISVGIRLGLGRGMGLVAMIGLIDAIGMLSGSGGLDAAYTIRTGVLVGTVLLTSYLYEEAQKTEADLADRLHQAEVLNTALEHQTLHDLLTNLPNRALLRQRMQTAIALRQRTGSGSVALLSIDLDRFKDINDTFGHQYGDRLLQQIGSRLCATLGPAVTVARLGGDEFAVLLCDTDLAGAERVARQLLAALEQPFRIADHTVDIGGSIGIALSPEHGADGDMLLRRADVAMYAAKRGAGGYAVFSRAHDPHSAERLALASGLRQAVEHNELVLRYQPKISLQSGRCIGVEALVRWQHPQRGLLSPDEFIPLAEQTGQIKKVSHWILNEALRQWREWQRIGLDVPIAVNLSMRDLHDTELPSTIAELLGRWKVPPANLLVEITENGMMAEPARALQTISALRALGLRIAIDDFGTGYSSLAYLKRLPVDELKIDRSFVRDLVDEAGDRAIVRSTIRLGHDLGLKIVAEGIEDAATLDLLQQLGCDAAQGYFISRPIGAADLAERFRPILAAA